MKVRELISQLKGLNKDSEVFIYANGFYLGIIGVKQSKATGSLVIKAKDMNSQFTFEPAVFRKDEKDK